MGRWDKLDSWAGDGLRREVFFFESGGVDLYGSLYVADPQVSSLGVAMCNSWGVEADLANALVHPLALEAARRGGAGLVFHYPGFGDSGGDPTLLTLDAMAAATVAAVAEGKQRLPGAGWALAGFMLGAAVASLALGRAEAEALVLVQPSLHPGRHLERLVERAKRIAALSRSGDDAVFGYSLGEPLVASCAAAEASVPAALAAFDGPGAVVRHSAPPIEGEAPRRFETIELEGTWRFGSRDTHRLEAATGEWLTGYMERRDDLAAA